MVTFLQRQSCACSDTVPTADLTRDFGVGAFRPDSLAFDLSGITFRKRDLYLIANVRYAPIIALEYGFVNQIPGIFISVFYIAFIYKSFLFIIVLLSKYRCSLLIFLCKSTTIILRYWALPLACPATITQEDLMLIFVINPGATSTKLAIFKDDREMWKASIEHSREDLAPFAHVVDQLDYRLTLIEQTLAASDWADARFDAVCGRGGLLRHLPSGTYEVNDRVLADIENPPYGEHASNLGAPLSLHIAKKHGCKAYFVDPVSVDELTDKARVSGFKGMERESFFHALNQKAIARKAAEVLGKPYEELNLIVCHMGGGVSVAAHQQGLVVDNYNVKDEGAFGMDRGGSLPVNAVINLLLGQDQAGGQKDAGQRSRYLLLSGHPRLPRSRSPRL